MSPPSRTTRPAGSRRSRRGPRWRSSASSATSSTRRRWPPTSGAPSPTRSLSTRPTATSSSAGRFVRLRSPFEEGGNQTAWMVVAPDASRAVVGFYQVLNRPVPAADRLRLRGLDPDAVYRVSAWPDRRRSARPRQRRRAGRRRADAEAGCRLAPSRHEADAWGDFRAWLFVLEAPSRPVSWCVPSHVYGPDRSTPDRSGPYSTDATVHMRPARRRRPKSTCMRPGDGHENDRLAGSPDPAAVPRARRRRRHVPVLLPVGRTRRPRRAQPAHPGADGPRRAWRPSACSRC